MPTFLVTVDDPRLTTRREYRIAAHNTEQAKREGARRAHRDDPKGAPGGLDSTVGYVTAVPASAS